MEPGAIDRGEYCRRIEAYLSKKNDGHLIRIVGPAFEIVRGWAEHGVPLAIAFQGIDRYFERYYAKEPRRRPVQIQFCDADVRDLFDEWRRAVGVSAAVDESSDAQAPETSTVNHRHGSLGAHLEKAIARLTALRGGPIDDAAIDRVVRELDAARAGVRGLKGEVRERFLDRLRAIDEELLALAVQATSDAVLAEYRAAAVVELAPFRERLPADAYERAMQASIDRQLRTKIRLPQIAFD